MHKAIKTAVQLQSERLRYEAQAKNADFLNKLNDNIKKIIKDQVKEQVKAQVSKILPKIKKTVNEQLEAEVLTRSSNESKTSHIVAANLSELELKNILIDKIDSNKSIHRSDEQKNLYEALRRRARKEPELISAPKEKTSKTSDKSYEGSKSQHKTVGESTQTEEPMHTTKDLEEPTHQDSLAQKEDLQESFNGLMDTPLNFSAFVMNQLKVDTLTPELLTDPTFELMKGSCKSLVELEYLFEEITGTSNGLKILSLTECGVKFQLAMPNMHSGESHNRGKNDNNSMDLLLTGNLLKMSTPNAESLMLRIQDIEDMLLLFVHGKLTNLTIEERLAFNVSLRMFTRSVVIQRRMEDLQLGVESYQKKLNLTKPDTFRSDLKRREAYTTYSNPRGFIYQNKDKKNRLMHIDEIHKFSDGTLNDVRTALNDRLKGIRMEYLPQTIWRQSDKDKAGAVIQEIDKQLKTRRITRSLEKFIGGRPYEGDFRLLQRTICNTPIFTI
ncbi:hypothetical protein Tco_1367101 [Tanacetum coccineum]